MAIYELILGENESRSNIIFSSVGYLSDTLTLNNVRSEIALIPKTILLDELIFEEKQINPISTLHTVIDKHLSRTPTLPFSMLLYSYQTENKGNAELEPLLTESAILTYYSNRFKPNEIIESTILNVRNKKNEKVNMPWPMASNNADFINGLRFLNQSTFKNLRVDSVHSHPLDEDLEVIVYSHLKPTAKISGFGVTPVWSGVLTYSKKDFNIISHQQTFLFDQNREYGLFEIIFNIEYFEYSGFVFPRYMTSQYKIRRENETYFGNEKILVTQLELENPIRPSTKILVFKDAPFDPFFWNTFNTIHEINGGIE